MSANGAGVATGLEVLLEGKDSMLGGRSFGLVTNSSAIDRQFRSAIDLMHERDDLRLMKLFGPEHGVRGDAQAGVEIGFAQDRRTGLPVSSLYGDTREPTPEMLDGLEVLVFDIQDVPVRFATYISTLAHCQLAAARASIDMVVLDRPNSLTRP